MHFRPDLASSVLQLPRGALPLDRVALMGILNVTPDSFYDGGAYSVPDRAVARAVEMVEEGADIIDIGGEKAGPGQAVPVEEELTRVIPVVRAVCRTVDVPVSIDTFKPRVAQASVEAGASIINSIGGFQDAEMRRVAAQTGAAVVVMHIKGRPRVAYPNPHYDNVVDEVVRFLGSGVAACLAAGISASGIIVDPGPDFGKTTCQSVEVLRGLDRFTALPYPVMLAVSRKRFIGEVLDLAVEERLEGSLAVTAWGVMHGIKIVRAHDVRATRRVITMTEAVIDPGYVMRAPA